MVYEIKFYIQDKNKRWVDFSNRLGQAGNRLKGISTISHKTESKTYGGVILSSISSVTMDNSDGFWDNPDEWQNLRTIDGYTAEWNVSTNGREISLQKAKCKISVVVQSENGTYEEYTLGIFYINEVSTSNSRDTTTLKLVSLGYYLKNIEASKVRKGKKWYSYVPMSFLIKELLKLEFAEDDGELPDGFIIPDKLEINVGERVFSIQGIPPNSSDTGWVEKDLTCRVIIWSYDDTVGKGLFLGCDNELWFYDIVTNKYRYIGELEEGYNIEYLFINEKDNNNIYGVGIQRSDAHDHNDDTTWDYLESGLKFFKYDGYVMNELPILSGGSATTITDAFDGKYCVRDGVEAESSEHDACICGNFSGKMKNTSFEVTGNLNTPIPFRQTVIAANIADNTAVEGIGRAASKDTTVTAYKASVGIERTVDRGFISAGRAANSHHALRLRFTLGQQGNIILSSAGTSGEVRFERIFSSIVEPQWTYFKHYKYDIATKTVSEETHSTKISDIPFQSICVALSPTTTITGDFIGGLCWDTSGNTKPKSYIMLYDSPGIPPRDIVVFSDTSDNPIIPLHMIWNPVMNKLIVAYSNFSNIVNNISYIGTHPGILAQNSFDNVAILEGVPVRLRLDSDGNTYVLTNVGKLYKMNTSGSTTRIGDLKDLHLFGNIVAVDFDIIPKEQINTIDSNRQRNNDIFIGIMYLTGSESLLEDAYREVLLWKFDNYMFDTIRLADFSDMSAWDALNSLLNVVPNYISGFDENGNFFLIHSEEYSTSATTISTNMLTDIHGDISKAKSISDIKNYIEINPSITKVELPSTELYAVRTTTNNLTPKKDEIEISVSGLNPVQVNFVCVRAGSPNLISTDFSLLPLFTWQRVERDVEAILSRACVSTDYILYVYSTFRGEIAPKNGNNKPIIIEDAINVGDFVRVTDSDSKVEIIRKIVDIIGNILLLDAPIGVSLPKNTTIHVYSGFIDSDSAFAWSHEGITTAATSGSTSTGATETDIYVTDIRNVKENLILDIHGNLVRVDAVYDYDATYDGYRVNVELLSISGESITWSSGDTIGGYFCPFANSSDDIPFVTIGNTGLSIRYIGLGKQFQIGDRITVDYKGLICENSDKAKQVAFDSDSIEANGKLVLSVTNNKFMDISKAKYFAMTLLDELRYPHYEITVTTDRLYPNLSFVSEKELQYNSKITSFEVQKIEGFDEDFTYGQGYTTDGTYHYITDNTAIYKFDSDFNLVTSNTDPFSGLSGFTYLGGCQYYDGKIYVVAEYLSGSIFNNQSIFVFDADDLSRTAYYDISDQGHEVAGLCLIPERDLIVIVSSIALNSSTNIYYYRLWLYDLNNFAYRGYIPLDMELARLQDITYKDGYFYVSQYNTSSHIPDTDTIWKIDTNGHVIDSVFSGEYGGSFKGLDYSQDELRLLIESERDLIYLIPEYSSTLERASAKITRFRVIDDKLFGKGFSVDCYPKEISHDLRNGRTILRLRSINPY